MSPPVCAIAGVGPGNGTAFAERFAAAGYRLALLARGRDCIDALAGRLAGSQAYTCDLDDLESVVRTFNAIRTRMGPIDTLIYNASDRHFADLEATSAPEFERGWRTTVLGCFNAIKQVAPEMRAAGHGNILVIGATAAWKGAAGFVGFCAAKAAQRSLAQSVARDLGPAGVHVAYVVIDAVIDSPRARQRLPDKPDDFFARAGDIAESVFFLCQQPRSAWSFEIDLRPFGESW